MNPQPTTSSGTDTRVIASRLLRRCDQLAQYSEEAGCLTRTFCSPAMREVHVVVAEWMQQAGMRCRTDAIGNLIGRRRGAQESGKTLLIGSHLDTVPNGGRYDGILGVMLAIAVVEVLGEQRVELPFDVDVVAFSDEEGSRYQTPFLGSRTLAGCFDPELLDRTDRNGVAMSAAIRAFGQEPFGIAASAYQPENVLGFFEAHIEQGPVLEDEQLPVGVVTAIASQTQMSLCFHGVAGHAGTTFMDRRHDALVAAAEFIIAVERLGCQTPGLVATVGRVNVNPNAANVIAGHVDLSLDVRHSDDAPREEAVRELLRLGQRSSAARGVRFEVLAAEHHPAVCCDRAFTAALDECVKDCGLPVRRIISGAGHDAEIMATITPVTMLFIRCLGGVSHCPDESVRLDDVETALKVMVRWVRKLAETGVYGMDQK